jgi:hypothetical protein
MGRSLFAIAMGFVLIASLTLGTDVALRIAVPSLYDATGATQSAPVLLLMMAYIAMYAVGGCYWCARLAPSRPLLHACLLGVLGLVATIGASIYRWDLRPSWFHVVSVALVMVYAFIGGQLRVLELSGRPARPMGAPRTA